MKEIIQKELELEFQGYLKYLDGQKDKMSSEAFKQLIIENWIEFCTYTIQKTNQRYELSEYELADFNLLYDKKFEDYYKNILKDNSYIEVMVEMNNH